MDKDSKIEAKKAEIQKKLAECDDLKSDLQRTRADFENYRKNTDARVSASQKLGEKKAILSLLPIVDDIERAIAHLPEDLKGNSWAQNVVKMNKNLEKNLDKLGIKKINTKKNVVFNPELHEAVQFDDYADGKEEVIAEELRAGYQLNGEIIRPAMVKVTRK